jgi:hypothetical protein
MFQTTPPSSPQASRLSIPIANNKRGYVLVFNAFLSKNFRYPSPSNNKSNVINTQKIELFQMYMKDFFERRNINSNPFIKTTNEGNGANTIYKNSIMIFDIVTNQFYMFIFIIDQKMNRLSFYSNKNESGTFPIKVGEGDIFHIDFDNYNIRILKGKNEVIILINI